MASPRPQYPPAAQQPGRSWPGQDQFRQGQVRQERIAAEALASLTEADIPPEDSELCWGDPDTSRPAGLEDLPGGEPGRLLAGAPGRGEEPGWPLSYAGGGEAWPAGLLPRDGSGGGMGFADGGLLDVLEPGPALAGFAGDAHAVLADITDDALIGVIRAGRRLTSRAQARELAAVAELARRRPAEGTAPAAARGEFPAELSEFISAEIAAALTLTRSAAEDELDLSLERRAATWRMLEAGRIDLPRAQLILLMLAPLPEPDAAKIEAAILAGAPGWTTGQLRYRLARAIQAVDPQAARARRKRAEKQARVERYPDPEGTATLTGRHLPPAQVLAAGSRLTRIARAWKTQGAAGGMDLLRAHAYLALLNGISVDTPPASLLPGAAPARAGQGPAGPGTPARQPGAAARPPHTTARQPDDTAARQPRPAGPGDQPAGSTLATGPALIPAGLRPAAAPGPPAGAGMLPPISAHLNLTIPAGTATGTSQAPGQASGHGPPDAPTLRALAHAAAGHQDTRWQVTITGPSGQAIAHGTAAGNPAATTPSGATGWSVTITAEPIAAGTCEHRNHEPGYRPSPKLQRLIRARNTTCTAPGCRRPSQQCDLDHARAYHHGGITCECDIAPLCRFHHRMKQSQGWHLEQPSPGVMTWTTPAGRRYITQPSQHPT